MPSCFPPNLSTTFNYSFRRAVKRGQTHPLNSIEAQLRQGRLLSGNSRLCCSSPFSTRTGVHFFVGPSTVFASRSNCEFSNYRNTNFIVGAILQTHSGSFVSGSLPCQAFEYHKNPVQRRPMAASGSKAASTDLIVDNLMSSGGNISSFARPNAVYFGDRSVRSCKKASINMRGRMSNNDHNVYGYFVFDIARRSYNPNLLVGPHSKNYHASCSSSYSDGAVPDVSLDASSSIEHLTSLAISDEQKALGDRTLKLLSGSCYLPHPDKEETGGEDAHFICADEQVIGVADGVGGWADVGVNAGEYSRELMLNSVNAIQDEPKGSINPARVLEKAHSATKAKGSSTACIIGLKNQVIHAINLGDSGFIVVRDGCTIFQSPVQQHGFNFTYQLESGSRSDLPSSGQVFTIPVAAGDIIVAGSDGLFDNLYNNEITAIVVDASRTGFGPEVTAQKIAALARQRAQDRNRQTPFSTAAQDAGFRYYGGKLDDITVVVSYISSSAGT